MDKEFSNIRIVDIAKMAGVSVGTVDRVIHNRGRVSEENRKKVQAILEMVNYQPNLMARSLASKKQYHFIAITPSFAQGEYWEAISEGIDKAASEMGAYNITITKLFFDQYDNKTFDDIVRNLLDKKVDGVLIATLFTDSVIRLSRELDRFEIPYIYVDFRFVFPAAYCCPSGHNEYFILVISCMKNPVNILFFCDYCPIYIEKYPI